MTKKQKNTLISNLLYYGGFILTTFAIIFLIIYTIAFNKHTVNSVHLSMFVLAIIGLITPQFAEKFNLYFYFSMYNPNYKLRKALRQDPDFGFIQGVPVNSFSEFSFTISFSETNLMLTKRNGIYYGIYNSKPIKLDMRGWLCKDKYVYEFFHTFYRLQFMKRRKMPLKYIYKTIKGEDIIDFLLIIRKDKNEKKYYLSKNYKIKSSLLLKIKNYNKSKFIDNDNFSIVDFYDFNMK